MKVFLFILFCSFGILSAQNPQFRNPELIAGKKDVKVNQIFQDIAGNLWFATSKGLVRYNGVNNTVFSVKDSLYEENCTAVGADKSGNIWVGHEKGSISYQKNGKFFRFNPPEGLPTKKITSILTDNSGLMWFGTNGEGLYYWDGSRMNVFMIDEGLTDDHVYDLFEAPDGKIWAATDFGISIINMKIKGKKEKFSSLTMDNGLPDNLIIDFSQDESKNLWIAMRDSGIVKYDFKTSKIQRVQFRQEWNFGAILSISLEENGNIWVGTEKKGVVLLKNVEEMSYNIQDFTVNQGIVNNNLFCVYTDHESNIWMGTANGVSEYFGDQVQFLLPKDGLNASDVYATYKDSKNNYWIGTSKGLSKMTKSVSGKTEIKNFAALNNLQVVAIEEDKAGYLWIGTYTGGVFRIHPKTEAIRNYTDKNGLPAPDVINIHASHENYTVYLATLGGGLSIVTFDEKTPENLKFTTVSKEQGLESQYVYSVFEDSKKRLWMGTDGAGLALYENGKITLFGEKQGLKSTTVYSVTEDINQHIWISTAGSGIFKYDGSKFENISLSEGLRTETPNFIYADAKLPELFIGHSGGIDRYFIKDKKFAYYGESEGLKNFDPHLNATYLDASKGILWIGTTNGITVFSTHSGTRTITPMPLITKLRIFLKDTTMTSDAVFAYDQNHVTFDFVGIYLKNPNVVKYKFKLDGYDRDWSLETKSTYFTYSNLPPGTYTFKVLAANENGEWSKEPATYTFTIRPPWYLTWPALIFFTLAIGGSVYGFYRRRIHQIEEQKRILEDEVEKRTREVVEQKHIIEEKNQEITDSIIYAKRIQRAILPSNDILKSYVDHFVFYKPKDIVSGDFYWFDKVGDHLYIAACDCTGHGVPGALVSMIGQNQLNLIVNESKIFEPDQILTELDRRVRNILHQDEKGAEAKDGMDAALCRVCTKTGTITFAGAMRPMYMVRNGEFEEIKSNKFPIGGAQQENKFFTPMNFELQKGDSFYLFSDGYVDQFGGEKGRKFNPKQLKELVLKNHDKPIDSQFKIFENAWENWAKGYEQIDDVVIIGVKMI